MSPRGGSRKKYLRAVRTNSVALLLPSSSPLTNTYTMPSPEKAPSTLYDKIYADHLIEDQTIYIDRCVSFCLFPAGVAILMTSFRHLVHEVTSPQAFEGLRNAGRTVRRPDCTLATVDHVCLSLHDQRF